MEILATVVFERASQRAVVIKLADSGEPEICALITGRCQSLAQNLCLCGTELTFNPRQYLTLAVDNNSIALVCAIQAYSPHKIRTVGKYRHHVGAISITRVAL